MNDYLKESPAEHDVWELVTAWNAGCRNVVDALVAQAANRGPEQTVRHLCWIAVRAVRIAAGARGVQPDDILAMISRSTADIPGEPAIS